MALKFRRGTTAQQSGSLAFGEPFVNTTLRTLLVGGDNGDIQLATAGTSSTAVFGDISGSGLDITGNARIGGNLTLGGNITIGDANTDTIALNADLSSSIIPDATNTFDLGSTTKVYRNVYATSISGAIAATNGVVSGSSQVIGILTPLNTFSGSQLTQNTTLATYTGSVETRLSTLGTLTGSNAIRLTNLESTTASLSQRVAANEAVSGTYARTNSANTFNGTQTVSGSLYITQDLIVQGSSSIQTISSSRLDIGDNIIQLNVNSPSLRFGGLAINDSGSAGNSGSFLYDSVQDEFIFVHKGNGTNVTSSHFVMGPETIDNLGNETYLTLNRLPKGTGKEHIIDSQITDDGTTVSIVGNLDLTGSMKSTQLSTLATYTGSVETRLSTLATYTGSVETRLSTLGTLTGSNAIKLANLESTTASLNISVANLNTNSSSYETKGRGIVSGSSQITLSSTTGYGSVLNQAVLTSSTPSFSTITSTVATGTAPLTVTSTTAVTNLNADLWDGNHFATYINQPLLTTSAVTHGNLTINGTITATGDITAYYTSDRRHKNNIQTIKSALLKVTKLNGVTWEWNDDVNEVTKSTPKTGLIAQEVQAVLPQVVTEREDGFLALDYSKMMGLMVEAIKEQQIQIDNLTAKVEELKRQRGL